MAQNDMSSFGSLNCSSTPLICVEPSSPELTLRRLDWVPYSEASRNGNDSILSATDFLLGSSSDPFKLPNLFLAKEILVVAAL